MAAPPTLSTLSTSPSSLPPMRRNPQEAAGEARPSTTGRHSRILCKRGGRMGRKRKKSRPSSVPPSCTPAFSTVQTHLHPPHYPCTFLPIHSPPSGASSTPSCTSAPSKWCLQHLPPAPLHPSKWCLHHLPPAPLHPSKWCVLLSCRDVSQLFPTLFD